MHYQYHQMKMIEIYLLIWEEKFMLYHVHRKQYVHGIHKKQVKNVEKHVVVMDIYIVCQKNE